MTHEDKIGKDKIIFNGHCFGIFDLLEYEEKSARVASNLLCELQEEITRQSLPICSSLSLCSKVLFGEKEEHGPQNEAIRTYTLLKPKSDGIQLDDVLDVISDLNNEVEKGYLELFWTASTYSYILTGSGNSFNNIFKKIMMFRDKTTEHFTDSFTYVGLNWKGDDTNTGDFIKAYTFLKLKKGFGDIKLSEADIKCGWSEEKKDTRLGVLDISLEINKATLREIKDAILELRANHKDDIASTSTLLLPQVKV